MGLLDAYGADDPLNQDPGNYDPAGSGGSGNSGGTIPTVPPPPPPNATGTWSAPTTSGGQGGGGGDGGGGIGSDFPAFGFSPVPKFSNPAYVPLDAQSVLKDPGYQFRIQQGEEGLQRSAASKGLLRSGGSLKDLIQYDQNFASNEYNQAENRNQQNYTLNYQLAKDQYAPLLAQWNTLSGAQLQKALAMYNRGTVWNAPRGGGGGSPEQLLPSSYFGL